MLVIDYGVMGCRMMISVGVRMIVVDEWCLV